MAKTKTVFICNQCGYESAKWYGKCPSCGEWDSMSEEQIITETSKKSASKRVSSVSDKVLSLSKIDSSDVAVMNLNSLCLGDSIDSKSLIAAEAVIGIANVNIEAIIAMLRTRDKILLVFFILFLLLDKLFIV